MTEPEKPNDAQIILYRTQDGAVRVEVMYQADNELKPILGLELTATPQIEKGNAAEPFKNVIYSYCAESDRCHDAGAWRTHWSS